jgi:hypothetical protein
MFIEADRMAALFTRRVRLRPSKAHTAFTFVDDFRGAHLHCRNIISIAVADGAGIRFTHLAFFRRVHSKIFSRTL